MMNNQVELKIKSTARMRVTKNYICSFFGLCFLLLISGCSEKSKFSDSTSSDTLERKIIIQSTYTESVTKKAENREERTLSDSADTMDEYSRTVAEYTSFLQNEIAAQDPNKKTNSK